MLSQIYQLIRHDNGSVENLVLLLGTNEINHEPISLINTLKTTRNMSHAAFHGKAQEIEDIVLCLKEH